MNVKAFIPRGAVLTEWCLVTVGLLALTGGTLAANDCGTEAACDAEDVIVSCQNVSNGPSSSSACYCLERLPRPCFDVCGPRSLPGQCPDACQGFSCPDARSQLPTTTMPSVVHPVSGQQQQQLGTVGTALLSTAVPIVFVLVVVGAVHRWRRGRQASQGRIAEPSEERPEPVPLSTEELFGLVTLSTEERLEPVPLSIEEQRRDVARDRRAADAAADGLPPDVEAGLELQP